MGQFMGDMQKISKDWMEQKGFKCSLYADFCHLVEEVGELGEALVVKHGEREPGDGEKGFADHYDIAEELGDVLFSTIVIANKCNVDLDMIFRKTIKRYDKKIEKREIGNH